MRAAFNAADVAGGGTVVSYLPYHKITSTIVVNLSSNFKTINFVGLGMLATRFRWFGPTTDPMFRINGLKQYIWESLLFENMVAKGTTVGILVQRDSGTGTQSGSTTWRNIRVSSFAKGIQLGNAGITQATSEYHFDHLSLDSNDIGCQIQDGNSLNFLFSMLEMGLNGTGVQVLSGGTVGVDGGSASGQTVADFDFQSAGTYAIRNFRSETANRFLIGGNTSGGTAILVDNCGVVAISNADGYGIRVGSGPIALRSNDLLCKVACSGQSFASVSAYDNAIADTQPVDFTTLGGSGAHYSFIGNRQVAIDNTNVGHFDDEIGFVSAGLRVPLWKVAANGLHDAQLLDGIRTFLPHPPRIPKVQAGAGVTVTENALGPVVSASAIPDDAQAIEAMRGYLPPPQRARQVRAGSGITVTEDALGYIVTGAAGSPDSSDGIIAAKSYLHHEPRILQVTAGSRILVTDGPLGPIVALSPSVPQLTVSTVTGLIISGELIYVQTVVLQSWVTASSKIFLSIIAGGSGTTDEMVMASGMIAGVKNLIAGTSFDIWIYNPNGFNGTINVNFLGVN